jgi:hypothetical protein
MQPHVGTRKHSTASSKITIRKYRNVVDVMIGDRMSAIIVKTTTCGE